MVDLNKIFLSSVFHINERLRQECIVLSCFVEEKDSMHCRLYDFTKRQIQIVHGHHNYVCHHATVTKERRNAQAVLKVSSPAKSPKQNRTHNLICHLRRAFQTYDYLLTCRKVVDTRTVVDITDTPTTPVQLRG